VLLLVLVILLPPIEGLAAAAGGPVGCFPATYDFKLKALGFKYAVEAGVQWHRNAVPALWLLAQPTAEARAKGAFDWALLDAVCGFPNPGLKVVWNLTPWGPGAPVGSFTYSEDQWKRFVQAVVERYDGDGLDDSPTEAELHTWVVANDANLLGVPKATYAKLLQATTSAARKADSKATLLVGAAGASPAKAAGAVQAFQQYTAPVLKQAGPQAFDGLMLELFGNAKGDYLELDALVQAAKTALAEAGAKDKQLWLTTGTWSGTCKNAKGEQTEAEQAADLCKRVVHALYLGVDHLFWAYGLVEGYRHQDTFFDHTGLIYDGRGTGDKGAGHKKAGFYTLALLNAELAESCELLAQAKGQAGASEVTCKRLPPLHVYLYHFPRKSGDLYFLWWDYFADGAAPKATLQVTLELPADEVRFTSVVPDRFGRFHWLFPKVEAGHFDLTLGAMPLLLETRQTRQTPAAESPAL